MLLVDTSVWIDHFRRGEPLLARFLEVSQVAVHPYVIGELACGTFKDRARVLGLLNRLPLAPLASHSEAIHLLGAWSLHGIGLGWIDVHLLASAKLGNLRLWTKDRRLGDAAELHQLKLGM